MGEMGLLAEVPARSTLVGRTDGQVLRVAIDTLTDLGLAARLRAALGRLTIERLRGRAFRPSDRPADGAAGADWVTAQANTERLSSSPIVTDFAHRSAAMCHGPHFLWRWVDRGIDATTLASVPEDARAGLRDTKLLATILHVLIDDLVDRRDPQGVARALAIPLRSANAAPMDGVPSESAPYFQLIADVWDTIWSRVQALPAFAQHRAQLVFDYQQVFNAARYALVLQQNPARLNLAEHRLYLPHAMNLMVFSTLDLMASPSFDLGELGPLRDAMWHAQSMALLSKMVVTWRREVPQRDFTSRVFAHAMADKVLSLAELESLAPEAIVARVQAAGIEDRLLDAWLDHRRHVLEVASHLRSVNLNQLVGGLESILGMTLSSRGLL
jgi:hypothetical protein